MIVAMKLYGTLTSPYVRKLRALIVEKKLDVEFVRVEKPADPEGHVRRLNPLGKVPVLELDDGRALYDSPVIAEYLDALAGPALIPGSGEARWQALRICALADGMLDGIVARLLQTRLPESERSAGTIAHEEWRVDRAVAALATDVGRATGPFLVGGNLSFADLTVAAAMGYHDFRWPERDWRRAHPMLRDWVEVMMARPSLRDTPPPK